MRGFLGGGELAAGWDGAIRDGMAGGGGDRTGRHGVEFSESRSRTANSKPGSLSMAAGRQTRREGRIVRAGLADA